MPKITKELPDLPAVLAQYVDDGRVTGKWYVSMRPPKAWCYLGIDGNWYSTMAVPNRPGHGHYFDSLIEVIEVLVEHEINVMSREEYEAYLDQGRSNEPEDDFVPF